MQYLIDASVYVFRAYYSMPDDMVDGDGHPTNALYGFCRFLGDFVERVQPDHIAVCFDESLQSSFRNDIYPAYKANREPAPDELKRQFQWCRQFTDALGLMEVGSPVYEADDLIGTLVMHGREQGRPSTIVSRDKDLAQLMQSDDIFWDYTDRGMITYSRVSEVFGVPPEQIADFLALAGDSVDNIPGVPGVGKKTATVLLEHFGSLESIYASLDDVANIGIRGAKTLGAKLEANREHAEVSRKLTGIACDIPIEAAEERLQPSAPRLGKLNAFFDDVGFGMALRRQAERIADLYDEDRS